MLYLTEDKDDSGFISYNEFLVGIRVRNRIRLLQRIYCSICSDDVDDDDDDDDESVLLPYCIAGGS